MKKRIKKWCLTACLAALPACLQTGGLCFGQTQRAARARTGWTFGTKEEYLVGSREENRELLLDLVSGYGGQGRQEFFVTGEDYIPESLPIAQMFPTAMRISNTVLRQYRKSGHQYTVCRIGYERTEEGESPPPSESEKGVPSYWEIGDILTWPVNGRLFRFRCIDEDYQIKNSKNQTYALFLCDTVIRSDVDSTDSQKQFLQFGETNNYKKSIVRSWMAENATGATTVNTGVRYAYEGATEPGDFSALDEAALIRRELPPQYMNDQIFLLSIEEALRYKDILWKFEGSEKENPEEVMSAFSRGYWLRTPEYKSDDNGRFVDGTRAYLVDLTDGMIRAGEITDTGIGVRPAFCLPQK